MAGSSVGVVVMRYVLPVLWMTLRLAVMDCMAMHGSLNLQPTTTSGVAISAQSLMSECLVVYGYLQ